MRFARAGHLWLHRAAGQGEDAPLVHQSGNFFLISARKEERILPASVVNDAVKEKVEEIESAQQRKVYKKERDQIKDDTIQAMLPKAFIRRGVITAAIAPKLGLIIVNNASAKRAEDLLSTLREVMGSLPVRPVTVKIAPSATLTDWLKTGQASEGFHVLDECELQDTHEDGDQFAVNGRISPATKSKSPGHWQGRDQAVAGLAGQIVFRPGRQACDQALEVRRAASRAGCPGRGEDALAEADATFVLMMMTFAEFLPALYDALGGEEVPASI